MPDHAVALLRDTANQAIDRKTARGICQQCAWLPLHIRMVGRELAAGEIAPEAMEQRLHDAAARWAFLTAEHAGHTADATGVLHLVVEQMRARTPEMAEQWLALVVFPASFDVRAAAAVWNAAETTARQTLDALVGQGLLQRTGDRFELHGVLHDLAEREAGDRTDARRRHAVHFAYVLEEAQRMYKAGHERVLEGLALFDRERANIEAGQQWAADNAGTDATAQALCSGYPLAGPEVLQMRLPVATLRDWEEAGRAAAQATGDSEGERKLAGNLGIRYRQLGEPERAIAYHEQSRELAQEAGDRQGEAASLGMLGHAYHATNQPDAARRAYEAALAITREIGDRRGEAIRLDSLGILARHQGDAAAALDWFGQALDVFREAGDRPGEGATLHNMGVAHKALEQWAEARDCLQQALKICEDLGDPTTEETRAALAKVEQRLSGDA